MSQMPVNDIPGNSRTKKEDNKPAIPEFKGTVGGAKRKKGSGFLAWMRKMFLSDRKPSEILKEIVENQIVPGIKDNFRNSIVSSVDMFMYHNARPGTGNQNGNSVTYNRMYTETQAKQTSSAPAQAQNNQGVDLNNGFENPVFRTMMEANEFLTMMQTYDYPTLSVHTLYMMRKKHIDYTWDKYGWTKEEIAQVKVTRISNPEWPYMIDLPQAHVIN